MTHTIKQYTVDAFTDSVFKGNPAAVCLLDTWLDDEILLSIARENNLSETAFIIPHGQDFALRWFTPKTEVDLCGHATLAAAFALKLALPAAPETIRFHTQSGLLSVKQQGKLMIMDFPVYRMTPVTDLEKISTILGVKPREAWLGRDLVCIFDDEDTVRNYQPDSAKLAQTEGLLCHFTAQGSAYDCISRSFGPKLGITEDPVCGSGHCHIFPYWAAQTGKSELIGYQASERSGILHAQINGDRMILGGQAVLFAQSEIYIG